LDNCGSLAVTRQNDFYIPGPSRGRDPFLVPVARQKNLRRRLIARNRSLQHRMHELLHLLPIVPECFSSLASRTFNPRTIESMFTWSVIPNRASASPKVSPNK